MEKAMRFETISFKEFLASPNYVLGTIALSMTVLITWICPFLGGHSLLFVWLLYRTWNGKAVI